MGAIDNQESMVEHQAIRDWMKRDLQEFPDSSELDLAFAYAEKFDLLLTEVFEGQSFAPTYLVLIALEVLEEVDGEST